MAEIATFFGYEQLTRTIQKFRFPQFWFANQIPEESIGGNIAQWDIEKAIIEIDTDFTSNSGEAQPVRSGVYGTRSQKMPVTFKFVALDPGKLSQLRSPGSKERAKAGKVYVTREVSSIQRRFGAYLDEFLVSKCLTGTLTISINGLSTAIDYGIPASHKPTAASAWSTSSSNLFSDITEWKRLIRKDTGFEPRWAICNQTVMNYMLQNDDIQAYMGSTNFGVQVAETGNISRFHGMQWIVLDHHYAQSGATERFDTPFVAENKVIMIPDWSPEWISMQRGTVVYPNTAKTDVLERQGPVMWSRVTDSPTGITLYYKNARLPALKLPSAVVYADVIP